MTGHGNVVFSDNEAKNCVRILRTADFFYVDDDYGLDKAFRRNEKFSGKRFNRTSI